jgi:hypothetical protein
MPSYNAVQPAALYPGTAIALVNNAATDTGVTTSQQCAIAPSQSGAGITVMVLNTTNQQAQGEFSPTDTSANYQLLSGCVVGPGAAFPYNLTAGWIRFTFAVAPTSGSLIVSR